MPLTEAQMHALLPDNTAGDISAQDMRDVVSALHAGRGVRVKRTTTQTILDNTLTAVLWDAEDFDTDGFHSTASDTDRLTVPSGMGGLYVVGFTLEIGPAAASGIVAATIEHSVDGRLNIDWRPWHNNASIPSHASVSVLCELDAAEYVTLNAYHSNTGNSRSVTTNSRAWLYRIN